MDAELDALAETMSMLTVIAAAVFVFGWFLFVYGAVTEDE
jgi:hypothetical protein